MPTTTKDDQIFAGIAVDIFNYFSPVSYLATILIRTMKTTAATTLIFTKTNEEQKITATAPKSPTVKFTKKKKKKREEGSFFLKTRECTNWLTDCLASWLLD